MNGCPLPSDTPSIGGTDRAVGRARRYRLAPQASTSRLERSTQVIDITLVYLKYPGPMGRLATARPALSARPAPNIQTGPARRPNPIPPSTHRAPWSPTTRP